MQFNKYGEYKPVLIGDCNNSGLCIRVCPFMNGNPNEDDVASKKFEEYDGIKHTSETGYYLQCFAGHVIDESQWLNATSGGIITWLAKQLLIEKEVSAVACVRAVDSATKLFDYCLVTDPDELELCKKSRYYPVEVSKVIQDIKHLDEKVLFIGLPCFIKGIHLARRNDPLLSRCIPYTIGLFCGHLKSKFYAEYLARSCGVNEKDICTVNFRKKVPGSPSGDYSFEVTTKDSTRDIPMRNVWARSWSNNLFMLNACEYCDDVMAETADVAVGDAWLPEYKADYRGTSIVVCRHPKMREMLLKGIDSGELIMDSIAVDRVKMSQLGGLRQRRQGLQYRLSRTIRKGKWCPQKRVVPNRFAGSFLFRLLQRVRIKTKTLSRDAFLEQKERGEGLDVFVQILKPSITLGKWINYLRHTPISIRRKVFNRFKKITSMIGRMI
jgi:coenzyme F420-reducing hydrogenase beta subunit